MKRLWILLVLALVGLTTCVMAAPSVYGPTGLITMPTAEYVQVKEMSIGADFLTTSTVPKSDTWFYKLNMGTYKNWEIGVVAGKVPTEGAFVNIKYYLTSDGERFPVSIALGALNLFSKDQTALYMVASKKFPANFSLHFGFKANFTPQEVYPSILGGVEYFLSDHVSILGDVGGQRKLYQVSAGMRVVLTPSVLLHLSAVDLGNTTNQGPLLGVGLSYNSYF